MNGDLDSIKYFMAAEKTMNIIYSIEQTIEFLEEYQIKADESVKLALIPVLDKMKKWAEAN